MCQYLVLNAEQKHIYMKILHRKDAYKSESMQLDYFQKNLFLYPTITEKQCDKVRYADTKIGGHMPNISSSELIAQFQTALRDGWGYIYGASGEIWTQAQQNAASREQTKKYGQKWVGHRVADCSGLFAWAFRQLGGYCYHGSNTMFRRYSSASGSLSAGKRTDGEPLKPGTAVYKFNASEGYHHVGLYIGEGKVIEAKGTAYGVVTSKIGSGWTH